MSPGPACMRFDRQTVWRHSRVLLRAGLSRRPPAPPKGRWSRGTNPLGHDSTSCRPAMLACRNLAPDLRSSGRRLQTQLRRVTAAEADDDRRRNRKVYHGCRLEMTGTAVNDQIESVLVALADHFGIVERFQRTGGDQRRR